MRRSGHQACAPAEGMADNTDDLGMGARRIARRDALVSEIAARLRHVCQHLSDDQFARLVSDIAETRIRFAAIDAGIPARAEPHSDGAAPQRGNRTGEATP